MTSGPGTAAALRPQRGKAADRDSLEKLHRHPDGTDGARPKQGALTRCECSLLAPAEPAGNPAAVETQVSGDGHKATMGRDEQDHRETETGNGTGQRTLLAHGMTEDTGEERRNPEQQHVLNACRHQGGEGEVVPLTQKLAPTARSQGPE